VKRDGLREDLTHHASRFTPDISEMDNIFDTITTYLTTWTRRRRWRDGLVWLPRGLLAGLMVAVVVATVARLRPFLTNQEIAWLSTGLAGLGLLVSAILLLVQRDDLPGQARFADRHFRLKERVRTAVDLQQGRIDAPAELVRQQLDDTLAAMQRVDLKAALPLKLVRRDWLVLGLAVVLLATAVYLPNPQEEILLHNQAVEESIAGQVEALEELKEEIENNPDLSQELRQELLAPIENALARLEDGPISQEEALAALSEAEIELRELAQAHDLDNLQQSLAGSSLAEAVPGDGLSETGQSLSQLAAQLPDLNAEQLASLARDLAETAGNLETIDPELAQQLADAAAALDADDLAAAQQALSEAAATLQERGQQAAASQQAQSAAEQLGEGRQEVAQGGTDGTNGGENGTPGTNGNGEGAGNGNGQNGGLSPLTPRDSSQAGAGDIGEGDAPSGVDVFVPDWSDLSQLEGLDIELPAECRLNPLLCGDLLSQWPSELRPQGSQVPYADVYGNYRDAANQALEEDYIPLGMRGFIRDYFSSLEP
jgi:hypothetical protein